MGAHGGADQACGQTCDHRSGGQIRAASRRLSLRGRGAAPRGLCPGTPRWTSAGSTPRPLRKAMRRRSWARWTASSSPAASASRGIDGMILAAQVRPGAPCSLFRHLPGHADRCDRICPPRRRDRRTRTPASSTNCANTRSSTSCRDRATRSTRAARCGWGPIPA